MNDYGYDFVAFVAKLGIFTFFFGYLLFFILANFFKKKVKELDAQLYIDLNCQKSLFIWDKNFMRFVYEYGFKYYKFGPIKNYARALFILQLLITQGFLIGFITVVLHTLYINYFCGC